MPEPLDRLGLVRPQRPALLAQLPAVLHQLDGVLLAVDVAGEVLGRPAELEQRLLEPPALRGTHEDRVLVEALAEHRRDPLGPRHLDEDRPVQRAQHQSVDRIVLQPQPAVAIHRVGDVDEQRMRHRVARVPHQRVDHLLGVMPGGTGVPQRERGDPVGVHMLRRALQLGKRRDRRPRLSRARMVDLQQEGLVRLHDQRAVHHASTVQAAADEACGRRPSLWMNGRMHRGGHRRRWAGRQRGASAPAGAEPKVSSTSATPVTRCSANRRGPAVISSQAVSQPPSTAVGRTMRSRGVPCWST